MRQRGDAKFIDLLNKIRVGNIDEDVQKQIRKRFLEESDINYPENALDMYAENYPTVKHNLKILDKFPGKTYTIIQLIRFPLTVNILQLYFNLPRIRNSLKQEVFQNV